MRFLDTNLQQVFADWRQAEHGSDRAIADNMWFDERISAARREVFEATAGAAHTGEDIVNRHLDYWGECVRVDDDIPHTFLPGLDPADLGPIDKTQDIVRIEGLARPLAKLGMSFDVLEEAKRTNNTALIKKFVQTWNESDVRDWRPAFAVFHDEVKDELESPDWAHRLRDRLGLAHYNGARPTPVALMKYKVQDVIDAATAAGTTCSLLRPRLSIVDLGHISFQRQAACRLGAPCPCTRSTTTRT